MTAVCEFVETLGRHSWISTGLDIFNDRLVSTRRCSCCDTRQVAKFVTGANGRTRYGRWTTIRTEAQ